MKNENIIDDEIDIRQMFDTLWKYKKFIILVFVIAILTTLIISLYTYPIKKIAKKEFILNFSGIETYKNPDGTPFNKEQIISPLLINNAYNNLINKYPDFPLEIDLKYLLNNIYVKAIIPQEIIERNKKNKETTKLDYYPNQFELYINRIDNSEIYEEILFNVLSEYKVYFISYYTKFIYFSTIPKDNNNKMLEEYDYENLIHILKEKIMNIQVFLNTELKDNNKENKINSKYFAQCYNISENINIANLQLNFMEAYIEQNFLTKNKSLFIQRIKGNIRQKTLKRDIEKAKLDGVNEIINKLANLGKINNQTSLEKENFIIEKNFIEKQVQDNYFSFLAKSMLEYSDNYKQLSAEIKFLENSLKKWQVEGNNKKNIKEISTQLRSLMDNLNKNIEELNQLLLNSFEEKYTNAIYISDINKSYFIDINRKILINVIIAIFCSLFSSIFLIFLYDFFKKPKNVNL